MKKPVTPKTNTTYNQPDTLPNEAELGTNELFGTLWKEKFWIAAPTMLVCGVAFFALLTISPEYKSSARLIIEPSPGVYTRPNTASLQNAPSNFENMTGQDAAQAQAVYIQSRDLVREVVAATKLNTVNEFERRGTSIQILDGLGIGRFFFPSAKEDLILKRFYKKLDVYTVERTRVIAIDFSSKDPELAAKVANSMAERYIERRREQVRETTRDATNWLAKEIETLQKRVQTAENKVQDYRAKTGLFITSGASGNSLTTQQLSEVSTQFTAAQQVKSESESKAQQIRALIKNNQPIESSDVLNSPVVQRMNEQIATVRNEIAQQSTILLPGHPRIQQLQSMLADYVKQVRNEAERVARGFENDAKIANARSEALQASLGRMKTQASSANEQEVKLKELERDAKTQRDLLESMMQRYQDALGQQNLDAVPVPAQIITYATPSSEPDSPKFGPIMLISFMGTFLLSSFIILMREMMKPRIYVQPEPQEARVKKPVTA